MSVYGHVEVVTDTHFFKKHLEKRDQKSTFSYVKIQLFFILIDCGLPFLTKLLNFISYSFTFWTVAQPRTKKMWKIANELSKKISLIKAVPRAKTWKAWKILNTIYTTYETHSYETYEIHQVIWSKNKRISTYENVDFSIPISKKVCVVPLFWHVISQPRIKIFQSCKLAVQAHN